MFCVPIPVYCEPRIQSCCSVCCTSTDRDSEAWLDHIPEPARNSQAPRSAPLQSLNITQKMICTRKATASFPSKQQLWACMYYDGLQLHADCSSSSVGHMSRDKWNCCPLRPLSLPSTKSLMHWFIECSRCAIFRVGVHMQ